MLSMLLALTMQAPADGKAMNALLSCMFGRVSAAQAEGLSPEQFEATLGGACQSEEATLRQALLQKAAERGRPEAAGKADGDEAVRYTRTAVIKIYQSRQSPK